MAGRKAEPGISYYKMNCGHTINKKVRLLFNEFDANGYWIWQCIIDYAYSHKGYYFDCNDPDALELFATDVCKKQVSLVNQVISGCIRRGLFDKTVFDMFGVLSSVMMQEIYLDATYERRRKGTEIELYEEFVLVNIPGDAANISIVPWNKTILPRKNDNVPRSNATDKSIVKNSKEEESIVNSNGVVSPQAPPKKVVGKKLRKEEEPEPYWEKLVEAWFSFYRQHYKIDPSFKDRDPKFLKKIVGQLKKRAKNKNVEWSELIAVERLNLFFQYAYKNSWLKEHFLLENLDKQFDVIIQTKVEKISLGKQQNVAPAPVFNKSIKKDLNYLYNRFKENEDYVTVISVEEIYFNELNSAGMMECMEDKLEQIKSDATKKLNGHCDEQSLKTMMKKVSVIELFKILKQNGEQTIFRVD